MPRSGTSWLSQIFDSHPKVSFKLSPLFSHEFKNFVNESSSKSKWNLLFKNVFHSKSKFINQTYRRSSGEYPVFQKEKLTRLVIKDTRYHNLTETLLRLYPKIKFIHIVRHPCGAINSWLKAPNEFSQNLNQLDEWRDAKSRKTSKEEFWGFGDWLYLTKKYSKLQAEFPNNVKVIYYEELVEKALFQTEQMFDFVDLKMTEQTVNFINKSQSNHNLSEYSVFKNKNVVNMWRDELHPTIINKIKEELIQNNMISYFNF